MRCSGICCDGCGSSSVFSECALFSDLSIFLFTGGTGAFLGGSSSSQQPTWVVAAKPEAASTGSPPAVQLVLSSEFTCLPLGMNKHERNGSNLVLPWYSSDALTAPSWTGHTSWSHSDPAERGKIGERKAPRKLEQATRAVLSTCSRL